MSDAPPPFFFMKKMLQNATACVMYIKAGRRMARRPACHLFHFILCA